MSVKEYFVGVETIDDKNPTATEIRFNDVTIWKRGVNPPLSTLPIGNSQAPTNDILLTEIYEDKEYDKNEYNPSIPPMNGPSIVKEDKLNQGISVENPIKRDVIKKGDSRPISETEPVVVSSKNGFNNIGDYYGQPTSIDKKKTVASLGREREKFIPRDTQRRSTFGGKKKTRKNKKNTKTMRRKRRNL
jgi:hypothetical protein